MDRAVGTRRKRRNLVHTLLLIGGMSLLLALCAELLFGDGVWPWVFAIVAMLMLLAPEASSHLALRLYRARALTPQQAPQLWSLSQELAGRAGLTHAPALYWVPSGTLNAFAVGTSDNAAIAVSDGLIRSLTRRELAGVLAHEVGHIASQDVRLMNLADIISRLTHMMSVVGILMALFSLPLMLMGVASISVLGLLLLIAAPTLSALLQLGLSRVREFNADLQAARLTGDPEGLASALSKIERRQGNWWQRLFLPGYHDPQPSLLRTHPDTAERIRRLLALRGARQIQRDPLDGPPSESLTPPQGYPLPHPPRRSLLFGIWR